MTDDNRKLAKGEKRFVAKKYGKNWRVYDRALGSFPGQRPGIGKFATFKEQADAEQAAEDAEKYYQE